MQYALCDSPVMPLFLHANSLAHTFESQLNRILRRPAHTPWTYNRNSPDTGTPRHSATVAHTPVSTAKIKALEHTVSKHQKTLEDLTVLNEELRRLPASDRLVDVIELNEQTIALSRRLLESAEMRLRREREVSNPPFAMAFAQNAAEAS